MTAIEAMCSTRSRYLDQTRRLELCGRFATLTHRERQVMALVTAGRLNKQVAWDLGLSEITVKVHRGSVMRKMGARTLADLVRMADVIADSDRTHERDPGSAMDDEMIIGLEVRNA